MILHPTIYKDNDIELFLEAIDKTAILHCYVNNWNKSSYKKYLKLWKEAPAVFLKKGFNEIKIARLDDDKKLKKFAGKFGFSDTDEIILDSNGHTRRLMKWS